MEGDNVDDWKINLNLLLWRIFTTSLWDSYLNSCILKANGSCWFLEEDILLPKHNQFDFCLFLNKELFPGFNEAPLNLPPYKWENSI